MMRIGNLELAETPQTIIGLDLSLRATGVVASHQQWTVGNVVPNTTLLACDSLTGCARLVALRDDVLDLVSPKSLVIVEGYAFGAAMAREALAELGGVVKVALHERGIPFLTVAPSQLKKFVTGKGNAEKSLVIKEVYKRFGVDCDDDNLADAVGLCFIGRALVGLWGPTTDAQREVLAALRSSKPVKSRKVGHR